MKRLSRNCYQADWPLGVNDFITLVGYEFCKETFMQIPKFMYIGDQDTIKENDNVQYGAFWLDNAMVDFLNETFGDTAPVRLKNMCDYLIDCGCNLEFKLYPGIGHEWNTHQMHKDFLEFFAKYKPAINNEGKSQTGGGGDGGSGGCFVAAIGQ